MIYKSVHTLDERLPLLIATALLINGTSRHPEEISSVLESKFPLDIQLSEIVQIHSLYNAFSFVESLKEQPLLPLSELFVIMYNTLYCSVDPTKDIYDDDEASTEPTTVSMICEILSVAKYNTLDETDANRMLREFAKALQAIPQCVDIDNTAYIYYLMMCAVRYRHTNEVIVTEATSFSSDDLTDDAIQIITLLEEWAQL